MIQPLRQDTRSNEKQGRISNTAQITQVGANVQSYSDTNGLSPNTRYYYRVRATNGTIDSGYSNAPFATTLLDAPAPPSNLTITSVLSDQVGLSWSDNSNNETGFKIQRKTGLAGTYVDIRTTAANVTSYTNSGLTDRTSITTGFVQPTRLETQHFRMKRAARHLWRSRLLLLRRQCPQAKSILPGLIIRPLRQDTRLSEKQAPLELIRRSTRWVRMCKATVIQAALPKTQDIIIEFGLPMGRLNPITRMKCLL